MTRKPLLGLALLLALCVGGAGTAAALEEFGPLFTLQSAAGATGNGTAIDTPRYTSLALQVTITNTATVTFEGTVDGTNWVSAVCTSTASTSATLVTTATASGMYQCPVAGLAKFRARVSAFTNGTITVTGRVTTAVLGKKGGGAGGSGLTSLNSQTGSTQTFTDDTNVTIVSGADAHVITWAGVLAVARGGTGLSSYTTGDLIYATGATTLGKFNKCADGLLITWSAGSMICGSVDAAPSNATFIMQTASSGTSAEQALSSLSSGCLSVTTGTGVIASSGSACGGGTDTFTMGAGFTVGVNPTASKTYYVGLGGWQDSLNCGEGCAELVVPVNSTLTKACWHIYKSGGTISSESVTHHIRKGRTTDTAGSSFGWNSTDNAACETGLSVAYTAGDRFVPKVITPAWGTNTGTILVHVTAYFSVP